ncbi:MAG: hypothetical protein Q8S73_19590 [Deltaproteobacteria bacterium]|nr:hypothetical protein [Myxococcales bacterium]MDP3216321.1 hypothetical protein [Deltaproteobacteria bacterium]
MSAIKIEFGSPEHGWLSVVLSGAGGTVTLAASDVPGNSLLMLATAACNVVDGRGAGEATWFLEPAEQRWLLRPTAEGLAILVQENDGDERCIATGPVGTVCGAIWRALRRLEVDPAWREAGDGRVWSHPFPHREVEHLGEELRRRRLMGGAA